MTCCLPRKSARPRSARHAVRRTVGLRHVLSSPTAPKRDSAGSRARWPWQSHLGRTQTPYRDRGSVSQVACRRVRSSPVPPSAAQTPPRWRSAGPSAPATQDVAPTPSSPPPSDASCTQASSAWVASEAAVPPPAALKTRSPGPTRSPPPSPPTDRDSVASFPTSTAPIASPSRTPTRAGHSKGHCVRWLTVTICTSVLR
mmetsp:Transcript_41817/g.118590  ORF Transcript_41817/g.118590 Transcript_41817/m.118590 type:complete len:200 (-) Transcript_41817:991-1590(-)